MAWYNFHYRQTGSGGGSGQIVVVEGSYLTNYKEPNKIKTKYVDDDINNVKYIKPNEIKTKYVPLSNNKVKYVEPNVIKVKFKC